MGPSEKLHHGVRSVLEVNLKILFPYYFLMPRSYEMRNFV